MCEIVLDKGNHWHW